MNKSDAWEQEIRAALNEVLNERKKLTKRQSEIYDYITDHYRAHNRTPTIAEIGKHFCFRSSASARDAVAILVRKEYLTNDSGKLEIVL